MDDERKGRSFVMLRMTIVGGERKGEILRVAQDDERRAVDDEKGAG